MAAFLKKACCNLTYSSISHICKVRSLQRTTQYLSLKNYATDEPQKVREILLELEEKEAKMKYTEEEIDKMRNVSRLRPHLLDILHEKLPDMTKPGLKDLYLKRKMYARYGEASGIDPKLCWPTKKQIAETMKDDAILDRPLEEVLKKAFMKQERDAEKKLKKEKEIDENMSKMVKLISEYKLKIRKHRAIRRQTRRRNYKIRDTIREVYGFEMEKTHHKSKIIVREKRSEKMRGYRDIKAKLKAVKNVKRLKLKEERRAKRLEATAQKETKQVEDEVSETPEPSQL